MHPDEVLNEFFNNINYDLAHYSNVITESRLENFLLKAILLLIGISIIKILGFYALNNVLTLIKKLPRDLDTLMLGKNYAKKNKLKKVAVLKNNGRKIKKLSPIYKQFKYRPWDHIVHGAYLIMYAAMFIAGYLLI